MTYFGVYIKPVIDEKINLPFDLKDEEQRILYIRDEVGVHIIIHSSELENISGEYEGEVIYEETKKLSVILQLNKLFLECLSDDEVVIYGVRDRIDIMSNEYNSKTCEKDDGNFLEWIDHMMHEIDEELKLKSRER